MVRKVRNYTQEFKEETLKLSLKSENICNTAKELGIPSATLSGWIYALKKQNKVFSIT